MCKFDIKSNTLCTPMFKMPSCRRIKNLPRCYVNTGQVVKVSYSETCEVNEALRTQQLQYRRNQLLSQSSICACESQQLVCLLIKASGNS